MKNVVILGDGMSDFEVPELQNKTPLEYGYLPNMNYLAQNGQVGMMKTIYEDLPVGSIVANMAILGFDPYKHYPNGRASFEALAQGIHLKSNDIAFRCNLISLDENKCISDFTSGNISDGDAKNIITKLDLEDYDVEIFPGQSYRNLIIIRNTDVNVTDVESYEPHCNIGTNINEVLPKGKTPEANKLIEKLRSIMLSSIDQIDKLNEQFETKADMIWLWSPLSYPSLPSFYEMFGKKGAIVAAMDFLKGIGVSSGMRFEDIPDVNGYIDTSYSNKLKYAKYFLEHNDFVDDAIYLNGRKSQLGLPTFIQNYFGELDFGDDLLLCQGEMETLNAYLDNATAYEWQDNSTFQTFDVIEPGVYWVDVTVNNCIQRDSISVAYNDAPLIDLGEEQVLCLGEELTLGIDSDSYEYLWSDGSTNSTLVVKGGGIYWVDVINDCGVYRDEILVSYLSLEDIIIPNVITPNGDDKNDVFIIDKELLGASVSVYNRWGKEVYKSINYINDWCASEVSSGVYFYYIIAECSQEEYKGWVQVIK